jgi:DNA-binding YbaB/EbfC family protein
MKGNIGQMMRQAQQMQDNMQRAQNEIEHLTVTAEASNGLVKVELSGKHELKRLHIDPQLMGDDHELLEDLIMVAINDAVKQIADVTNQKLSQAMGGMRLPPGMKMPF